MLTLTLALLLSAPPAKGARDAGVPLGPGPTAAETAKLFFLAGDVAKAQEWAQRGLKREPKTCGPLNKQIAEYAFLLGRVDEFTPQDAKAFFDVDRAISPTVRGKLTEKAWEKYVKHPLELATSRAKGDEPGAREILEKILIVDPANADAKALLASLGTPDAGR